MDRQFAIWILILASLTSYSQDLAIDATYYDKDGNPYKIERKYTNNQSTIFVRHDNNKSVCVKRYLSQKDDTTIIQETYYHIFNAKTKLDKFKECDSQTTSSNTTGDTVTLSFYNLEEYVGDTILTGEAAKDSWDFMSKIKTARVPMILDNKINVSLDSLIPNESFQAYFVHGLPVKVVTFNSKQQKCNINICDLSDNQMLCKSYFLKDTLKLYQVDTIKWNLDTSEVTWKYTRLDWNESYITYYSIDDNRLTMTIDTKIKEIEFLDNKYIFQNLLTGNLLYNDVLYYMELRLFDREKTVKVAPINGQVTTNKYTFDEKDRVTVQETIQGQEIQKRIIYLYEKE